MPLSNGVLARMENVLTDEIIARSASLPPLCARNLGSWQRGTYATHSERREDVQNITGNKVLHCQPPEGRGQAEFIISL